MAKPSELIQCYVECSDKHRIVKDICSTITKAHFMARGMIEVEKENKNKKTEIGFPETTKRKDRSLIPTAGTTLFFSFRQVQSALFKVYR